MENTHPIQTLIRTSIAINPIMLSLIILFTISCNKYDETVIVKEKIDGYVQKGPFINGTSILLSELDVSLNQTGKSYTSQIISNRGNFEMYNIELSSRFVQIIADGYYFNEVNGDISISPLTLRALSDVQDKTTFNVNILTHLEKSRVEYLVGQKVPFAAAKDKAQKEVLAIFGFQNSTDSNSETLDISIENENNAILLAISIIIQGNRSVAEVSELLADISTDIREDGSLDSSRIRSALYNVAQTIDLKDIRKNLESRYSNNGASAAIPDFEQKVSSYLNSQKPFEIESLVKNVSCYGLSNGRIDLTITGGTGPFKYKWSTGQYQEDISTLPAGSYTVIVEDVSGMKLSKTFYVSQPYPIDFTGTISHESTGEKNGRIDISVNGGTPPYSYYWSNGEMSQSISNLKLGDYSLTLTDNNQCTKTKEFKVKGSVMDIEGNYYEVVAIGSQIWTAENLRTSTLNNGTPIDYIADDITWENLHRPAYCWYENDSATIGAAYGALYNWYTVETGKLCPAGWHVPTDNEWTALTDYLGGSELAGQKLKEKGTTHWSDGNSATNETGFTALGASLRFHDGRFISLGNWGFWWTSTEETEDYAWYRILYSSQLNVDRDCFEYHKASGLSIRCLKD